MSEVDELLRGYVENNDGLHFDMKNVNIHPYLGGY